MPHLDLGQLLHQRLGHAALAELGHAIKPAKVLVRREKWIYEASAFSDARPQKTRRERSRSQAPARTYLDAHNARNNGHQNVIRAARIHKRLVDGRIEDHLREGGACASSRKDEREERREYRYASGWTSALSTPV